RRGIDVSEIQQCFVNRDGGLCEDTRAEHLTDPVTRWFVAQTNRGRELKIMYMPVPAGIELKSAYEATAEIIRIYNKYAK
ncbi:MAG: ADP-ribosyl-(dinitrogen reductase) hydrolase, partial [Burkholderiaceae bacterium]|nr:ADP-ribosyl-(dinitrogen reductase) hydrolase [Burkholderiaceae bacterium]